jgi:predicted Zn finger-like uncharacterized protein
MEQTITCPTCGTRYRITDELAGREAKCGNCGTVISLPSPAPEEPPILVTPVVEPAESEAMPPSNFKETSLDMQASPGPLVPTRELTVIKSMVDRGSYVDAIQALRQIEPQLNNHPGFYFLNGLAYVGLGNYPHALDNLTRAIDGGVRTPEAYASKGKAELELGQWTGAVDSLDMALELAGTDIPDYIADLAKAYDGAQMSHDAAVTWSALAQISPNHPALVQRKREREEKQIRRRNEQVQEASLQMQKEQRASDTAFWICIILRILLECL